MAIIWYEHFDLYGNDTTALLARGYSSTGSVSISSTIARTGTHSLDLTAAGNRQLRYNLVTPLTQLGQGCAIRYNGTAPGNSDSSNGLRFGVAGSNGRLRINSNSAGGFGVYVNSTLVGSSNPGIITVGSWMWIEVFATSGPGTTGTVEVRLNGATIINLSGLTLTDPWTNVGLGTELIGAGHVGARFDDWIVWDTSGPVNNNFIGDTFVLVAPPTGDGVPNDWEPNTGTTRWTQIDEAVPSDADFIRANSVGNTQEFAHQNLNLPIGAVTAIATQARAYKTDSGASSIRVGLASGSSTTMGPERALATGPVVIDHIANLDPNGNVPWTQNSANAARLRLDRIA